MPCHPSENNESEPELILLPKGDIQQRNQQHFTLSLYLPEEWPADQTYVLLHLCSKLITTPTSGHSGTWRTIVLIQGKYWWPSVSKDVNHYVSSSSTCAQAKVPCHFPSGKLILLPTLQRTWSHIAIDFITESEGYNMVLVVVGKFSHGIKLVSLPALSLALEMAEIQVFRYCGIPEDIVSGQGPQFITRVWFAFMEKLGKLVNLTLGYHPQSNGQVEQNNQDIGRYLHFYCADNQSDWARFIPWVRYAQKSLKALHY